MKDQLTEIIVKKLSENKDYLKGQFSSNHPVKVARHFVLDDFLPLDIAESVHANFPKLNKMRKLNSSGELKMKYSHIKNTASLLQDLHQAIQNPKVIAVVEEITGIKNQLPDCSRLSGGVSALLKGNFINPHLDNSHDIDRKFYRTVNLLYYVSPGWKLENGGNYELWDESVKQCIVVPSLFNRLVVMETTRKSWHAVNPVVCEATRYCFFNYYFSQDSPEEKEYFHTASSWFFNPLIKARPEQKIRRKLADLREAFFKKLF
jgi:Rps23 Pro-64 3,4-dihydroxylase Tpa1-like proline 4-hydroxylase